METIGEFWEPGVNEHPIVDDLDFVNHVEYIHYNPVKHGLAKRPLSWPHSSFRCYVRSGLYLPEWGSEQHRVFLDAIKDV